MKDWWQKLTIDWPCALGDWLWAMLVVAPAKVHRRPDTQAHPATSSGCFCC